MANGVVELAGDVIVYEALGDVSSVTSITEANLYTSSNMQAASALIIIEGNAARFTIDGTTPTNANGDGQDTGMPLGDGDSISIRGFTALKNFKVIEHTAGSTAYVHVTTFA